jgi:tetratricopeptide (TPR) repeat protein
MGTSLSEPTGPGGFEVVARRVALRQVPASALNAWSKSAISRLIDRLYFVIRHEMMSGDQDELRCAVEQMELLTSQHGLDESTHEAAGATMLRALLNRNARRYEVAKILANDVLERAPKFEWAELRYDAHITLADAAVQQGQLDLAQTHYKDALALAERLGDDIGAGRALLNMSALALSSGRPHEAVDLSHRAFEHFLEQDDGRLAGWALIQEAKARQVLGDIDAAFECADRAKNLFEVLHNPHGLSAAVTAMGLCHLEQKLLEDAEQAFERARQIAVDADLGDIDNVEVYMTLLEIEQGKLASAGDKLFGLEQRFSNSGRLPHLFVVYVARACQAALVGDFDATRRFFDEATSLYERIEFYDLVVPDRLETAAAEVRDSDPDLAAELELFAQDQRRGLLGGEPGSD